ncbi:hypothetical protein J6590_002846 [Homalodisca vitripennis]|nr:hypothetical protein J6590_002846 [Homalodisca vitripennis]
MSELIAGGLRAATATSGASASASSPCRGYPASGRAATAHTGLTGGGCISMLKDKEQVMLAVCIVRRCIIRCGLIRIKNAHRLLSCDVTSRHYPTTNGPSWLTSSPPPDTVM